MGSWGWIFYVRGQRAEDEKTSVRLCRNRLDAEIVKWFEVCKESECKSGVLGIGTRKVGLIENVERARSN